jgi:ParB family chromosome partitioning protein
VKAEGMLSAWLLGHGLIAPFVSPDHYVLTLDQLIAFAIVDDHERQEAAFERLAPNHEPYMIRRVLLETKVPARDRRARFVGLEAYEAAAGHILRDLFAEGLDGFLEEVPLLGR